MIEKFRDVFGAEIYEGYGLSETSPVATFNQKAFGRKPGTVGRAIWGTDAAIAAPEPQDRIEFLGVGEIGEVVLRGHNLFAGYLNNPAATAAVLVDGWFRTGDLGTIDSDGFISIVDRTKDLIIRGGFNVYPREVEEVLMSHPGIAQVAVVGFAQELHGEEICAVVVRSPEGGDLDAETSDRVVQGAVGAAQVPAPGGVRGLAADGAQRQDPQAGDRQDAVVHACWCWCWCWCVCRCWRRLAVPCGRAGTAGCLRPGA